MQPVNNPFRLVTDNPAVIKILSLKSELMLVLRDRIVNSKQNQTTIAELCQIQQPRVSALVNGHIDQFSLDELIRIATYLGIDVSIAITNQGQER